MTFRAETYLFSRREWEEFIEQWIFNEEHRGMLARNMLDGRTYEQIAEEYGCSRDKVARLLPKLKQRLFSKI